ncbi:MAG: L-arabinose isomerase [Oscillospiraceae bacterium]
MNFWFITGSQALYGEETLRQVACDTKKMVEELNRSDIIPFPIVWKPTVTTSEQISDIISEANYDKQCAGIITFMHTFSPSKMWISGLCRLQKPYCHLHTQFNREIPWNEIDMDFMNLNQSAHGDREHGFIGARLRAPRKIVVGYWENDDVKQRLADFMRAAVGVAESRGLKVARFGDNMREVAVTEGDKVEAEIKLGWSVNYYPVGDLLKYIADVTEKEIDDVFEEIKALYVMKTDNISAVKYQIREEIGLRKFLEEGGFGAFTTNFEDLYGLEQLPGMACQRLMADGFGFGGEGDWKAAAMTRIMKTMSKGLSGGTAFMEDYTYHMPRGNEMVLGAHMLEVCPSIAGTKPCVEVHPLGIGGKGDPARLTFDGAEGNAICVSLVDMGGRMRMIVQDVKAVAPLKMMPKLPVAGTMWKPLPNLQTAAEAWILAGGAHHTVMSYALNADNMRDFAEMLDIEFVHIGKSTEINEFKKELLYNDIAYKLK